VNVVEYTHAAGSGAARYVANLSIALVERGVGVDLVCPSDFAYAAEAAAHGVRIAAGSRSLVNAVGRPAKLRRAVRQSVVGARIAGGLRSGSGIVHLNFVGIPALALPVVAWLRLRGRCVVLTVHDVWPHRPLLAGRLAWFERSALAWLYRSVDHLIVHYAVAAAELQREFGVAPARTTVIPHGAHPAVAGPPARSAAGGTVRLAVLGSLRPNKGVHLAIGAVQDLRGRGLPVELVIAGRPEGPDADYWRTCQAQIESAPAGITTVASWLSDADMRARLLDSDAVLLPYGGFSAQSGVAIDALASGRPLIATAAGGLGELLERSCAGIRIEAPTRAAVCAAIEQAVGLGPAGLAALGAAGAAYAGDALAWSRVADRHIELYRRLAGPP
jgi:glycogen(starch) synthase